MNITNITSATVRVMKSFDYSHFEITLSSTEANTPELVDNLRKTAARLADKAVEQYKVAKENARLIECDAGQLRYLCEEAREIEEMNESERTPEQQAKLKVIQDRRHRARLRYDYEDDWQEPDYSDDE